MESNSNPPAENHPQKSISFKLNLPMATSQEFEVAIKNTHANIMSFSSFEDALVNSEEASSGIAVAADAGAHPKMSILSEIYLPNEEESNTMDRWAKNHLKNTLNLKAYCQLCSSSGKKTFSS
jgi:hypothetical protein